MELALNRLLALAVILFIGIGVAIYLKSGTETALNAVTGNFETQVTEAFGMQDSILGDYDY